MPYTYQSFTPQPIQQQAVQYAPIQQAPQPQYIDAEKGANPIPPPPPQPNPEECCEPPKKPTPAWLWYVVYAIIAIIILAIVFKPKPKPPCLCPAGSNSYYQVSVTASSGKTAYGATGNLLCTAGDAADANCNTLCKASFQFDATLNDILDATNPPLTQASTYIQFLAAVEAYIGITIVGTDLIGPQTSNYIYGISPSTQRLTCLPNASAQLFKDAAAGQDTVITLKADSTNNTLSPVSGALFSRNFSGTQCLCGVALQSNTVVGPYCIGPNNCTTIPGPKPCTY